MKIVTWPDMWSCRQPSANPYSWKIYVKGPQALATSTWPDLEQQRYRLSIIEARYGLSIIAAHRKECCTFITADSWMFLIKQALHEWVTVISAEEDTYTWWGWSVVLAFVTWSLCLEVEQSAPRVPVFSPPHNGGSRVENLWIMKSLTQGNAHMRTHIQTHTHTGTHMLHSPHLCKTLCTCAVHTT